MRFCITVLLSTLLLSYTSVAHASFFAMGGTLETFLKGLVNKGQLTEEQTTQIQTYILDTEADFTDPNVQSGAVDHYGLFDYLTGLYFEETIALDTLDYLSGLLGLDALEETVIPEGAFEAGAAAAEASPPVVAAYTGNGNVEKLGRLPIGPNLGGSNEGNTGIWGYKMGTFASLMGNLDLLSSF